jgi:hypothetical protein
VWVAVDEIFAVGRQNHGRPEPAQLGEQMHQSASALGIEVAGRLIAEQQIRAGDDRSCDRDQLTSWRCPSDRLGGFKYKAAEKPSQRSISATNASIGRPAHLAA